ncbi:MAG: hypothetical protein RIR12_2151 [Bacteroidota bacterium]|jgi:hypothetical protein
MNKIISVISLAIIFLPSFAQVSGTIKTPEGHPLPSVSITLHKKNNPSIIAFAIADKNGKFTINYKATTTDTLELKAALLGYSKQSIYFLLGEKNTFEFVLSPEAINLPEVKVKNPVALLNNISGSNGEV